MSEHIDGNSPNLSVNLNTTDQNAKKASDSVDQLNLIMQNLGLTADDLEKTLSSGLEEAFQDIATEGLSLSDALGGLGERMSELALNAAIEPVAENIGNGISSSIGNLIGGIFGAGGGSSGGGGEAALLSNMFGQGGSQPMSITMNVNTQNAHSFERSSGQIASSMSRMLSQSNRYR